MIELLCRCDHTAMRNSNDRTTPQPTVVTDNSEHLCQDFAIGVIQIESEASSLVRQYPTTR